MPLFFAQTDEFDLRSRRKSENRMVGFSLTRKVNVILDAVYFERGTTETANCAAHVRVESVLYIMVDEGLSAFRSEYDVIEKVCI
jgi:hypothetical protein